MINSVFSKANFQLCSVPHPTSPPAGQYPSGIYPYAPVHIGVHYVPTGFNGAKIWLSNSPYAPGTTNADHYENPCVWRSDDTVYPPTNFIAYSKNPLIGKIGTSTTRDFNSDPDIIIANDELILLNREFYRNSDGSPIDIYSCFFKGVFSGGTLTDFTPKVKLIEQLDSDVYPNYIGSPALIYWQNKYTIFDILSGSFNSSDKNMECKYIRMSQCDSLGLGSMSEIRKIGILSNNIEPWHISVFEYSGKLYAIVNGTTRGKTGMDSARIYFAEFDSEVKNLFIHSRPLTDFRTYRSDAFIDENGLFILYASSYLDTFNGGTGAGGVDMFVTSMYFSDLYKKII